MDFTQDHEKYAEKCVAMALSSEQDVDKALWLSLAQSWARLGEQVASVQHQSGAAAPSLRGAVKALDLVGTRKGLV